MIKINAPTAPPTTAGMGMEDLLLEPGSPVPEVGAPSPGVVGVTVREVSMDEDETDGA